MRGLSLMTCRWRATIALALLGLACGHRHPPSCYPESSFAAPALQGGIASDLTAMAAQNRPDGVVCELSSSGFLDVDQVLYVLRAPARVVVRVSPPDEQPVSYEAPLDDNIAGMLERLCATTVRSPVACVHTGHDGTWYNLRSATSRSEASAMTWSPRPQTSADAVVDVFSALRAYATAPPSVRRPALSTLYRETYAAYQMMGLFEADR